MITIKRNEEISLVAGWYSVGVDVFAPITLSSMIPKSVVPTYFLGATKCQILKFNQNLGSNQ